MRLKTLLLAALLLSPTALAEMVVIGHPSGPDSITLSQLRDIYFNRSKQLPDGQTVKPFELTEGNATRAEFHSQVTERNDAQLKAYWAQQVFSGRGQPPQEQGSAAAMKAAVASTLGAIGYIDSGDVDGSVKVISVTP